MKALAEAEGPLSANELWERLRSSRTGLATVYRGLRRCVEDGDVVEVEVQAGAVRYEPADLEHHHHFLCSFCDRVFDLLGCVKDLERLLAPGFTMTGHEVLISGRCPDCEGS